VVNFRDKHTANVWCKSEDMRTAVSNL